jgi:hypothetical protein
MLAYEGGLMAGSADSAGSASCRPAGGRHATRDLTASTVRRRAFDSKTSAERWLTLTEAEIIQGDWIDPDARRVLFGNYARDWIEERPNLRLRRSRCSRRYTSAG